MVFSQPVFLCLFLPVLLIAYAAAPRSFRNFVLVIFGVAFYACGEQAFLPWMAISILLNYYIARWLDEIRSARLRLWLLSLGIASDLGLLLYFKYTNLLADFVDRLLSVAHLPAGRLHWDIALPLGISFFTFHKISYKVDVYRGTVSAKKSLVDVALYILLFPQLIAGPIVRYNEISSDLDPDRRALSVSDFCEGARIFIIGLGKKLLIADVCAIPADKIFAINGPDITAGLAWVGLISYALQIYYDFAGYSDMAIGLGRMFGFHFPINFNYPYSAESVADFWRRWHMSLSRWFRDYVYIPLGGNRISPARTYLNLFAVFTLCGLWHGASWSFLVWGLYHGTFLAMERLFLKRLLAGVPPLLRHAYALLVVIIGWCFFRCSTIQQSCGYLVALAGLNHSHRPAMHIVFDNDWYIAILIGAIGSMPAVPTIAGLVRRFGLQRLAAPAYYVGLLAILGLCMAFMASGTFSPFIYFRF